MSFKLANVGLSEDVTYDDALWPLLIVRMVGPLTDLEFEAYLARRKDYLEREQRHVLIYDVARSGMLTPGQRQRQADWIKEHTPLLERWSIGSALVITSPALRLVMSIVRHLSQSNASWHTVRSLQDAAAWAAERFVDEGMELEARRVRDHFGTPQAQTQR